MTSREHMTKAAAETLARRIARYWRNQGFAGIETFTVEWQPDPAIDPLYFVRSNIRPNGYPPRAIVQKAA